VLLRRRLAGRARSRLAIGGGKVLRRDDSALLELPDSVCCVTDYGQPIRWDDVASTRVQIAPS